MSPGAIVFLLASWTLVLGLTFWSFWKIMKTQKHFDPDGIGPADPPVPAQAEPGADSPS